MSVTPQTPTRDYLISPDADFVDIVYLTDNGAALDMTGKELLVYVWRADTEAAVKTLTSGDGLTIGSADTIPVDEGLASLGIGLRVVMRITEAEIQAALPPRGGWRYLTIRRNSSDGSDPESLVMGQIAFMAGRPR